MEFFDTYGPDLLRLAFYGVGIAVYTLLVAVLYVPMGDRLMFATKFGAQRTATPGQRFAYVFLFPFVSFGFFLVVSGAMLFLASFAGDAPLAPREILTVSMGIVLAVRLCAYFSESAATELAKVMPLGMLGVVLVTNQFADVGESFRNLARFLDDPALLGIFFGTIVLVEFVLRGIYELLGRPGKRKPAPPTRRI